MKNIETLSIEIYGVKKCNNIWIFDHNVTINILIFQ